LLPKLPNILFKYNPSSDPSTRNKASMALKTVENGEQRMENGEWRMENEENLQFAFNN